MLPDVGATELLLIAAVALIVVGPKDLPALMRKVGQFMARMRGMAAEFRASFDEMARQSELDELRREVQALRSGEYLGDTQAAAAQNAEIDDIIYEIEEDLRSGSEPEPPVPNDPPPAVKKRRASKPKAAAKPRTTAAKARAPRKSKPAPEAEA